MTIKAVALLLLTSICVSVANQYGSNNACEVNYEDQSVPDCNCKIESVDHAVKYFISPLLSNLADKKFFRYFYVDLEKPCPFYQEDAACMMEGCSVCACNENEIPSTWLSPNFGEPEKSVGEFGWVSSGSDDDHNKVADSTLGKINLNGQSSMSKHVKAEYMQHLRDTEDCDVDDWTSLSEAIEHHSSILSPNSPMQERGMYVNLLHNPERYTGYGGPSARRVWNAISEENCFGDVNDICLEKRVFHRLMVGLRTSISVHIAKEYRFVHEPSPEELFLGATPTETWGKNIPLYYNAVGNHPDRLHNIYFSFLFLLRAVVRAGNCLSNYPYSTGNSTEDAIVTDLIARLVASKEMSAVASAGIDGLTLHGTGDKSHLQEFNKLFNIEEAVEAVEECKYGFDESELFQVSGEHLSGPQYDSSLLEKQDLREQFRNKFRNISQIMNCVTCEKCRLWGKIQILGFGTAIKILLTPEEELVESCSIKLQPPVNAECQDGNTGYSISPKVKKLLSRQEIIALLNTLKQFATSIEFVANVNAKNSSTKSTEKPEKAEVIQSKNVETTSKVIETETVDSHNTLSIDSNELFDEVKRPRRPKKVYGREQNPENKRIILIIGGGCIVFGIIMITVAWMKKDDEDIVVVNEDKQK